MMGVTNHWTGTLDWNTGLEHWTGTLDWTTGLLDWTTGLDYWTGLLDWTTGLTYFWFLHILRLVLLIPASQGPSENLQSATKMMSMRSGSKQKLTSSDFTSIYYVLL